MTDSFTKASSWWIQSCFAINPTVYYRHYNFGFTVDLILRIMKKLDSEEVFNPDLFS